MLIKGFLWLSMAAMAMNAVATEQVILLHDPAEQRDVLEINPQIAEELKQLLDLAMSTGRTRPE